MGLDIKVNSFKEKIMYKLQRLSYQNVLGELKKIRRYYKDYANYNCHEDLKPIVNNLFTGTGVFGPNMLSFEKSNAGMETTKNATKRFCLLSLAHITSKLTRNSKDYPQDVIVELEEFLKDIGRKSLEIRNVNEAPMETYIDNVKSVFNADMIVTQDNYNKLDYVKETRTLVNTCLNNPHYLGFQDVNEKEYKNREIKPNDIKKEDIDTSFNIFLRSIESGMFGANSGEIFSSKSNGRVLDLLNLINGKDEQDKKEIERFNSMIQVEDVYGFKKEIDQQSLADSINRFRNK